MRFPTLPLASSIAAFLAFHSASAATFFWDGGATQTADADGGAGIWDAITQNWDTLSTGGLDTAWGNTNADIATFGGTAGTVTVGSAGFPGGALNVGGLTFTTSGYVIGDTPRNGTLAFGNVQGSLVATTLPATTGLVTINSNLTGTAGLTVAGTGATSSSGLTRFSGDNRGLTGGIAITAGGITATSTIAFGSNQITISGGATLLAATPFLAVNNNIAISGTANFRAYSTSALALNGVISETAANTAFTIVDTGIVRLNGINTYTGVTNVNSGIISFSNIGDTTNGGNLGKSGSLSFNSGGTLRYTGATASTARNIAQPGSGSIDIVDPATTFSLNGNTSGGASGRILTKTGLGTVVLGGTADNGSGRFGINAGTLILNKTSSGTVHSIGSGGNTDIGLTMNGGTVRLSGTGGDQIYVNTAVQINAGTFDMNGLSEGFDSLSGTGGAITNTAAAAGTLTLGQNNNAGGVNNSFGGIIRDGVGTVNLVKVGTGTQILAGANTYTGTTTISAGTLQINSGGTLGTGAVTNNATLAANSAAGVVLANAISGSGALTKANTGVLTLSGTSTYSGDTTVNAGTLDITGSLTSAVTVNTGAILSGSGSTSSTITLNEGSTVIGGTSVVTGNGVTANILTNGVGVLVRGGSLGSNTYDVIKYGAGSAPAPANFSLAGYRAASFADDTVNKKITLTYTAEAKAWNTAVTDWTTGTSATWTGGDSLFQTGDVVTFGDIAADTSVTVTGTVAPSALGVTNTANNLTLSGTGSIGGVGGLNKSGNGTLTLATANTYFGQTLISQGTVKLANNAALGATGIGNETIVSGGGTLDLNGGLAANALILAPETIKISGTGVGGAGALINSGANAQQNALSYVTLTGDASVGGTARFDIRNNATGSPILDLGGFKLTKVGTNQFTVVGGTITSGDIDINAGTFQIESNTTTVGTGTITIAGGATLGLFGNLGGLTRPIVANSNGTAGANISNAGSNATIGSNITLTAAGNTTAAATVQLTGTTATTLTGNISGTGSLNKANTGSYTLSGTNTYAGYTLISSGLLRVGSATAIPSTTRIILYNANTPTFDINGFNVTVASLQSGSAPDTGAVVNLGASGGRLTVTGNTAASGPGNLAGQYAGRFAGIGDIEYNNAASPQGAWDWLNTSSDYTGTATITSGRLRFAGVNGAADSTALGNIDNDLIFNGTVVNTLNNAGGTASLQITNGAAGVVTNLAATRDVTLNSGREGTFYVWGNTTFTVNGIVSGAGNLRKEDLGTLQLTNTSNSYGGETKIVNGTLLLGTSGVLPDSTIVRLGSTDATVPTLNLNGKTETIGGLTSVQLSDNSVRTNGVITSSAGAASLTINSSTNQTFGGSINGTVAITKSGTGTQTFAGSSTFDGGTIVAAGTLLVTNTTGSGLGVGPVTVNSGATLGGTGTIAPTGSNGIAVNGNLAPGVGLGTLTLSLGGTTGTVALGSASLLFDLGAAGADINTVGSSDLLSITGAASGDVAFSANSINFGGTGALGWYKLFDTDTDSTTWTGLTIDGSNLITSGLAASNLAGGLAGEFFIGDGTNGSTGDIYLHVIPEPTSAAVLVASLGLALGLRRRRTAKA